MKHLMPLHDELTAKQRLAVSRQSLAIVASEPLWASLARWCIRRCVLQYVKAQPNRAAGGRTLS